MSKRRLQVCQSFHWYSRVSGELRGPFAAIVTEVIAGNLVNATVLPPRAPPFEVGCVMLDKSPSGNTSWGELYGQAA